MDMLYELASYDLYLHYGTISVHERAEIDRAVGDIVVYLNDEAIQQMYRIVRTAKKYVDDDIDQMPTDWPEDFREFVHSWREHEHRALPEVADPVQTNDLPF